MGTFFELGKDKAAKGDTVGLQPPLPLRLIGYEKPLPFNIPFSKFKKKISLNYSKSEVLGFF